VHRLLRRALHGAHLLVELAEPQLDLDHAVGEALLVTLLLCLDVLDLGGGLGALHLAAQGADLVLEPLDVLTHPHQLLGRREGTPEEYA
jgi:hypothetical protein